MAATQTQNLEATARQIEILQQAGADVIRIAVDSDADVEAEAKSFAIQRPFYESNPDLFQHRLVTETMQRVLTNAVDVFYLSGRQPRIWLNRTPAKKKLKEGEAP